MAARIGLASLPEDSLQNILSCLSVAEVLAAQRVSRRLRRVARDESIWEQHLRRDWSAHVSSHPSPSSNDAPSSHSSVALPSPVAAVLHTVRAITRIMAPAADHLLLHADSSSAVAAPRPARGDKLCTSALAEYRQRTLDMSLRRRGYAARHAAAQRASRGRACDPAETMHILGIGSPMTLVTGFVITLMLKLLKLMDAPWVAVFAPLLAIPGLLALDVLVSLVSRCSRTAHDDDVSPITVYGVVLTVWSTVRALRFRWARMVYFGIMWVALLVATPVCTMLKLDGVLPASWPMTFMPLWVFCIMWCGAPWVASGAPALQHAPTHRAADPPAINVVDASQMHAVAGAGAMPNAPAQLATRGLPQEPGEMSTSSLLATAAVVLATPLCMLLLLAAMRLEGIHIEAQYMFIPLWFLDGMLLLGCCSCVFMSMSDDEEASQRKRFRVGAVILAALLLIAVPGEVYTAVHDHQFGNIPVLAMLLPCALLVGLLCAAAWTFIFCAWRRVYARRRHALLAQISTIAMSTPVSMHTMRVKGHVQRGGRLSSSGSSASSVSLSSWYGDTDTDTVMMHAWRPAASDITIPLLERDDEPPCAHV